MMTSPSTAIPRLEMRGVSKRFGATKALDGVALTVQPGEVHALVGENGAGKSTLMKILSGALRPDDGSIRIDGQAFAPDDPLAARDAGVAMIYQELNLAPHLTVEQNISLGAEQRVAGFIQPSAFRERIKKTFALLKRPDIRHDTQVRRLSSAERQLVEIARALLTDARVLVMDEPTSSLGLADIEHLFTVIEQLRKAGVSIIYISHFLEEIQRVAQRYSVLRDGRKVAEGAIADVTMTQLVETMIGRRLDQMYPHVPHTIGDPILRISGFTGLKFPINANLTLHRGEILGLAGLIGAGRTELLRGLFGLDPIRQGTVSMSAYSGGKQPDAANLPLSQVDAQSSPTVRLLQGMGLLSEDRQGEGLALSRTISENMTLSRLSPFSIWGWLNLGAIHKTGLHWIKQLEIRTRGPNQRVLDLSGGNQQKVALARLLHHDVDILMLDEPTRGIDVASKAQFYRVIGELAAKGKAVIVVSSYVPELIGICDRIAVIHRGRLVAMRPTTAWTDHEITAVAASGKESVS